MERSRFPKKRRSARSAEAGASAHRRPVASGIFYPAEPAELKDSIGRLLEQAGVRKERAVAVIVPHAAIRWAGPVSAAGYACVKPSAVAVVVGPSHSSVGARFGIGTRGGWETPLGVLPVEGKLARKMLDRAQDLQRDEPGHREEHAVEVQLPFLQRLGVKSFVPLSIGSCDAVTADRIGEGLALAVKAAAPGALWVATANWGRYVPPESVAEADAIIADALSRLDGESLLHAVKEKALSMCGAEAVAVVFSAVKRLGARRAVQVGYRVHRDTASAVSAGAVIILE